MRYFTKELVFNNNYDNYNLLSKKIDEYNLYYEETKSCLPQNYVEAKISCHDAKISSICFLNKNLIIDITTATTFKYDVQIEFIGVAELSIEKILLDNAWFWLYDEVYVADNNKYEFNILIANSSNDLREIKVVCNDIIIK